jgi:MinD superfamily P-loop ATPase
MAVKINSEKCGYINDCPGNGLCIQLCEQGTLIDENNDVKVVDKNCDNCNLCITNCPNQAITSG